MGKNSAVVFLSNRSRARRRARDRSLPLAGCRLRWQIKPLTKAATVGFCCDHGNRQRARARARERARWERIVRWCFSQIVLVLVVVLVIDLCPWLGVSIAMADQT